MDIVIAKYDEDVSWTTQLNIRSDHNVRIAIYDKSDNPIVGSIPLPNMGRESHTFVSYILDHYDRLPDVIMFLQGDPFDHGVSLSKIQSYIENGMPMHTMCESLSGCVIKCDSEGCPHHSGLRVREVFHSLFPKARNTYFTFSPGAQYVVTKDAILQHPLTFWQKILNLHYTREWFPYEIERLWSYIFGAIPIIEQVL